MRRIFISVIVMILLAAMVLAAYGWMVWQRMQQPLNLPSAGVVYDVPKGATLRSLAHDLQARGLLSHPYDLEIWGRWIEPGEPIKAGEFFFKPKLTLSGLLALLRSGKPVQHPLTIVEGTRFSDAIAVVETMIDKGLMVRTVPKGEYEQSFIQASGEAHAEGWLLPDTYHIIKGQTDLSFLLHAYRRMKATLRDAWAQRDPGLPLNTPYEALILASIVEKETASAEERPLIAGVFINRLKKNMRLQTDPTVIYGMGKRYAGNIRTADLREDTPYNTYVHKGLPPTPIALPGADAILAVVHPEDTKALYFVAKGGGRHYFSDTYKKHKQAVIKYLLNGDAKRYGGRP